MWPLTFHFHNLISVLNHLVFRFVAEGMSPGLDQVQDLVSDVWFCLFLVVKEPHRVKKMFLYTFKSFLFLCSTPLLSHCYDWANWIKQHCVWTHEGRWEVTCFGLKNPPVTGQWHHQEVKTSMCCRSQCHMVQRGSNRILLNHAVMQPAVRQQWTAIQSREGWGRW